MAQVFGTIECLTKIKTFLNEKGITDFHSVGELLAFQKNCNQTTQSILEDHYKILENEKTEIPKKIQQLKDEIITTTSETILKIESEKTLLLKKIREIDSKGILFRVLFLFSKNAFINRYNYLKNNQDQVINKSNHYINRELKELEARLEEIKNNLYELAKKETANKLKDAEFKKNIIEELTPVIYGAIGEQKVEAEIKKMPDNVFFINDFYLKFDPPIYNQGENDYIYSMQADHIVISTAGIFLIETKNWSKQSIANLDLRSPIKQIKRSSFALYIVLNDNIKRGNLLKSHHWGNRKLSVKNLIVMGNEKPPQEFEFVKILKVEELVRYLNYFKPIFSDYEVQSIARFLIEVRNRTI